MPSGADDRQHPLTRGEIISVDQAAREIAPFAQSLSLSFRANGGSFTSHRTEPRSDSVASTGDDPCHQRLDNRPRPQVENWATRHG